MQKIMREIKFRYWDNASKSYIPNQYWAVFKNKSNSSIIVIKDYEEQEWLVGEFGYSNIGSLEQFTGLQDKNGVDIYEGDIVRLCENDNGYLEVCFKNHYIGGWVLVSKDPKHHLSLGARKSNEVEVIGNIHTTEL
tara:strand:- start:41 stop:448 length:408 start_codon:yes stop_codon:yes gene_type:complete